jgi:hypothetical protein
LAARRKELAPKKQILTGLNRVVTGVVTGVEAGKTVVTGVEAGKTVVTGVETGKSHIGEVQITGLWGSTGITGADTEGKVGNKWAWQPGSENNRDCVFQLIAGLCKRNQGSPRIIPWYDEEMM